MPHYNRLLPPVAIVLAFVIAIFATIVFLGLVFSMLEALEVTVP